MKILNLSTVGLLTYLVSTLALAGAHVEHGGKNPNNASTCKVARITRFKPPALSVVPSGSAFSFMVFDAHNPKNIVVTVKKQVVPLIIEDKGEMLVLQGKLPELLKNTAARIQVKVKGKTEKCNSEEGWLLKISD